MPKRVTTGAGPSANCACHEHCNNDLQAWHLPPEPAAERRDSPEGWLILSARHGLVHPNQVVTPDNLSLRQLTRVDPLGDWVAIELTDPVPQAPRFGSTPTRSTVPRRHRWSPSWCAPLACLRQPAACLVSTDMALPDARPA